MDCNSTIQNLISGELSEETKSHLESCDSCSGIAKQLNEQMDILDMDLKEVPDGFSDKVMSRLPHKVRKISKWTYSEIIQLAAVLLIGVFIGMVLGRNADLRLMQSAKTKKVNSLIELKEKYHLDQKQTDFRMLF